MRKIISVLVLCALANIAQAKEYVTVPELEGGFTASVGTFYAMPSTQQHNLNSPSNNLNSNNQNNRQFGTQGSIGYIFDNSSNGIEASGRRLN
jgi:hypothetical protein